MVGIDSMLKKWLCSCFNQSNQQVVRKETIECSTTIVLASDSQIDKFDWLKNIQSFWSILAPSAMILGAIGLLMLLHREGIAPVFIYLFDQPLLFILVLLVSFFSVSLIALMLSLPALSLYDDLKNKLINLFFAFSISLFVFIPALAIYLFSWLSVFPVIFGLVLFVILYKKYDISISAIIALLLLSVFSFGYAVLFAKIEFSSVVFSDYKEAIIVASITFFMITFFSVLAIDPKKRKTAVALLLISIFMGLNSVVWNAATNIAGIRSFNSCYVLDGEKELQPSRVMYRFGKVWVSCNGELETFDEKIDTCLIIKDGKVQEQFTRVLPIK
jgi:hypothetical protein